MTPVNDLNWITNDITDSWESKAACTFVDENVIFSESNDVQNQFIESFCSSCPVISECLEFAMVIEGTKIHSYRFGVFGGMLPYHRSRLSRIRRGLDPNG